MVHQAGVTWAPSRGAKLRGCRASACPPRSSSSAGCSTADRLRRGLAVLLAAAVASLLSLSSALAAPGDLDLTFSDDGLAHVLNGSPGDGKAVVRQPDGKLIVGGASYVILRPQFGLVRFNADGTLDTSFDGDGKVITSTLGNADNPLAALALQPDGKIVAAGSTSNVGSYADFALVRYNADGSLDASFDGDGKVITSFGFGRDEATSVIVQPDGKIVAAGLVGDFSFPDFGVARYQADGSLDPSFDGDGMAVAVISSRGDVASSMVLQPDGKLVVGGHTFNGATYDLALVRFLPDGSLDPTFDGDGIRTLPVTTQDWGYAMALQPDGKLLVAGKTGDYAVEDVLLVRFNADGSLDTSFDDDGIVITGLSSGRDVANGIALQPDGKILVAGETVSGGATDFFLLRYDASGQLDPSFGGGDGIVITPVGTSYDSAAALLLEPDGRIVVAGTARFSTDEFAVARYLGGTCGDGVLEAGEACDDGLFCDGVETCDAQLGCRAGTPPATDDGVACTVDGCDEAADAITHTPSDQACDDGLFCDGVETCDAQLGCRAGTPPAIDDGVACTVDACDESSGEVTHLPDDAVCEDGDVCTADACDVLLGCTNTPTLDSDDDGVCDEQDVCTVLVPVPVDRATLRMTRLGSPLGDETLSLSGLIRLAQPVSPPLDPVAKGLRVVVEGQDGQPIVDETVPSGAYDRELRAGWRASRQGTSWTYSSRAAGVRISNASLRLQSDRVMFRLRGRFGSYPVPLGSPKATLVLDPPRAMTGQCAEITWPGSVAGGLCTFSARGDKVTCR